jgi:hypothetical protein
MQEKTIMDLSAEKAVPGRWYYGLVDDETTPEPITRLPPRAAGPSR